MRHIATSHHSQTIITGNLGGVDDMAWVMSCGRWTSRYVSRYHDHQIIITLNCKLSHKLTRGGNRGSESKVKDFGLSKSSWSSFSARAKDISNNVYQLYMEILLI